MTKVANYFTKSCLKFVGLWSDYIAKGLGFPCVFTHQLYLSTTALSNRRGEVYEAVFTVGCGSSIYAAQG